jgi:hypothetical protein
MNYMNQFHLYSILTNKFNKIEIYFTEKSIYTQYYYVQDTDPKLFDYESYNLQFEMFRSIVFYK